jgi:hypothetical protein
MAEFIFFMHGDAGEAPGDWGPYLDGLRAKGVFDGGSGVGGGTCARKAGDAGPITDRIVGYIRVRAADLAQARELLAGNPVYEAGGTVEIRELPKS